MSGNPPKTPLRGVFLSTLGREEPKKPLLPESLTNSLEHGSATNTLRTFPGAVTIAGDRAAADMCLTRYANGINHRPGEPILRERAGPRREDPIANIHTTSPANMHDKAPGDGSVPIPIWMVLNRNETQSISARRCAGSRSKSLRRLWVRVSLVRREFKRVHRNGASDSV